MEDKVCNTCGWDAEYVLDGEYFCEDCILEALEIELEEITLYRDKHGRILGNSEDDWMIDILQGANDEVEEI